MSRLPRIRRRSRLSYSISRITGGVAHEVKNPLMTILTGVKVLSRRMTDADEPTRRLLQDMLDAVGRADTIIGGLLSYSRQTELRDLAITSPSGRRKRLR